MKVERMTRDRDRKLRPVIAAAIAASVLMLVYGLTYRVLAARLATPVNANPIPQPALDKFPAQIGNWTGQEVAIDEDVVRATDTDAHLSRRYSRRNGLEFVSFYLACGVRARDLMPHRPEVCYTGAGWTLVDKDSTELPLADGMKLPCNVMQFSQGALNKQRLMVLDYYIVDGQYCADVSLLRSKAWRGSGTVGYVAQVQIVTAVTAVVPADSAAALISDFAVESASSVTRLFVDHAQAEVPISPTAGVEGDRVNESN